MIFSKWLSWGWEPPLSPSFLRSTIIFRQYPICTTLLVLFSPPRKSPVAKNLATHQWATVSTDSFHSSLSYVPQQCHLHHYLIKLAYLRQKGHQSAQLTPVILSFIYSEFYLSRLLALHAFSSISVHRLMITRYTYVHTHTHTHAQGSYTDLNIIITW